MTDRRKHPSGKPVRKPKQGTETYYRRPLDGPLNPRLHRRELAPAIGFHRFVIEDDDE